MIVVYATPGVLYPCRRHPQYSQPIMSNHIPHVDRASPAHHHRRLYLEQADMDETPPPTPKHVSNYYCSCPQIYLNAYICYFQC